MASLVKPLTWALGVVLTLVGVLGFFQDPVLGLFEVDQVHNIIHLASGLVALGAVMTSEMYARWYLLAFGAVYALVTVLGFMDGTTILGLFAINPADNYLHLGIAAACLIVGLLGTKKSDAPSMTVQA